MTIDEYKIKWMKDNGFVLGYCNYRKCTIYEYNGYTWTYQEVKETALSVIIKYKRFYDGLITEKQLNNYKEFEKLLENKE